MRRPGLDFGPEWDRALLALGAAGLVLFLVLVGAWWLAALLVAASAGLVLGVKL